MPESYDMGVAVFAAVLELPVSVAPDCPGPQPTPGRQIELDFTEESHHVFSRHTTYFTIAPEICQPLELK